MNKKFLIADLAAIETHVVAWLAQCGPLLEVFEKGRDPYLDLASKMFGIPYDTLSINIKSKDPVVKAKAKRQRQIGKPGILGCVYRLGGGQMGVDPRTGDPKKFGLYGYADAMGIEITQEQAHEIVRVFREAYHEIVEFWYDLEKAVKDVLDPDAVRVKRKLGPDGCLMFDKIRIIKEGYRPQAILRMHLPSGRCLHYMDASIKEVEMPWEDSDGNRILKSTLVYMGQNQETKQWSEIKSHGGKLCENATQAVARDVFADKLLLFEEADMPVIAHAHDEGVAEVDDSELAPNAEDMIQIMSEPISWAPGLPLGADGFQSKFYKKG